MSERNFLDSNVLLYTDDNDAPRKQKIAFSLIENCRTEQSGVISSQVLQEYFSAATRKLRVPADIAQSKVRIFAHFPVVRIDVPDIIAAIDLHRLYRFSFWDALVIRTALESGCTILYSEDLQDGQKIENLRVIDPFGS